MDLRSQLRLTDEWNGDNFFYPVGALRSICRQEPIRIELAAVFPDWAPDKVNARAEQVCSDGMDGPDSMTRLFVILILIRRLQHLESFIAEGIKDCHLPLSFGRQGRELTYGPQDATVESCGGWEMGSISDFHFVQKKVLAPCFQRCTAGKVTSQLINPEVFMPWTEKEALKENDNGNYSRVYAVKIHENHHQFVRHDFPNALTPFLERFPLLTMDYVCCQMGEGGQRRDRFALKVLKSRHKRRYLNELECLNRCAERDNLVELYGAYERGDKYSFLFPWADGGSLRTLWTWEPRDWSRSKPLINSVRWIAYQCYRMASEQGLGSIHDRRESFDEKQFGIHGDIKPENILLFTDQETRHGPGVLKISDMGFTGFYTVRSRSRLSPLGPCSPTYRAPEHDIKNRFLSRKSDIWGLGCVFSEFLSWFILGPNGVKNYNWKRYHDTYDDDHLQGDDFFRPFDGDDGSTVGADLKPSVIEWIDELCDIVGTSNFFSEFLTYIRDNMLVVDCQKRAECHDVSESLRVIYGKCLDSKPYCTPSKLPFHTENLEEQEEQGKLKRGASDVGADSHDSRFKRARYFRG
ncbi:kinase-like protein [Ophiocordyceps camponoti-floridani]|uniref:Kinase-like protein n=1 Tax=Ophiocordyceps camponoti-floridani TaxID=2030778 RepID=A0A8H4VAM5_9HYPO|nr:kinase-like protein [Ophiocordyceps camponoti-floridani]